MMGETPNHSTEPHASGNLSVQLKRQECIARLGRLALGGCDLDQLMTETVAALCDVLHVEYAKVLEYVPSKDVFRVRVGRGWRDAVVGDTPVPAGTGSQAGYTFVQNEPVVVPNLDAETRFKGPSLLLEHGVKSGISVTIRAGVGKWGVLGAHSTAMRTFEAQDVDLLERLAEILGAAIERNRLYTSNLDSHRRLADMLEHMTDGFMWVGRAWRIESINPRGAKLLQRTTTELVGESLWNVFPEATGSPFHRVFHRAVSERVSVSFEAYYPPLRIWLSVHAHPADEGLYLFLQDITLRKATEEALRASEEKLHGIISSSPVPIIAVDTERCVTEWNPAAERLLGWTREEVIGRQAPQVSDEQWREFVQRSEPLFRGESIGDIVVRRRKKDGSPVDVSIAAAPITNSDGEAVGFMAAMTDVTERTRFLQVAAHELRNPMATILANSALLKLYLSRDGSKETLTRVIGVLDREIQRFKELLDEVLEAFRIREGRLNLHLERVNLLDVVESALSPFALVETGHRFVVRKEYETSSLPVVVGDFRRLEEVVRNLATNAVKYSPQGGEITVSLSVVAGRWAQVSVSDSGLGIPRSEVARIFDGFFRGSNVASREPGGMGLGLHISKEIIERHGGRIWAESKEGEGTSVYVRLPLSSEESLV